MEAVSTSRDPNPNRLLRRERELRGWSQRKVANEIGTNVDTVSKWERGINIPDPHFREKLCDLFGKNALELGFIPDREDKPEPSKSQNSSSRLSPTPHPVLQNTNSTFPLRLVDTMLYSDANKAAIDVPLMNTAYSDQITLTPVPNREQGNEMDRHAFVHGAARLVGATILMPDDILTSELLDRFIRAMKKPSHIDETTLTYLEVRTDGYWKDHYDATFATHALFSDVATLFQKVTALLEGSLLPTTRTRLCVTASRIAQLAGTLYFDMGSYACSKRYKQAAIQAAREASYQELEAVAWGRLSMACMYGEQIQEALVCIQEARRLAVWSANFTVHAWLAAVEAEIHAKLGNRESCLKALDAAECVESEQQPDTDSHWLHFDRPSLTGYQGACYRKLYRPDDPQTHPLLEDARKALITTLALPTLTQRRPNMIADLADTYVQQVEIGEACRLAGQAVAMTAQIQSGRNLQRLLALRRDLEPWKNTQEVKDLDSQLAPLLSRR